MACYDVTELVIMTLFLPKMYHGKKNTTTPIGGVSDWYQTLIIVSIIRLASCVPYMTSCLPKLQQNNTSKSLIENMYLILNFAISVLIHNTIATYSSWRHFVACSAIAL